MTALEISSDHTYIAVGHEEGHVYLYQLSSSPSTPARSVAPIPLSTINKGHKEGHLKGSRILHVGFVGKRHTAVVTGDDKGMAFYHSLGRVLGVDSTDVLRILGSYPDPAPPPSSKLNSSDGTPRRPKRKTPTTLFATSPLPLVADSPHSADDHHFTALLTPAKLVIVGLKPSPRTWFRRMRAGEGGEGSERVGTACWKPSFGGVDPALAFSWGRSVRFVRVLKGAGGTKGSGEVDFVEDGRWEAQGVVLGMQWQSQSVRRPTASLWFGIFTDIHSSPVKTTASPTRHIRRSRGCRHLKSGEIGALGIRLDLAGCEFTVQRCTFVFGAERVGWFQCLQGKGVRSGECRLTEEPLQRLRR